MTYFAYLDEFGHIGPYVSRQDSKHNDSPVFGLAGFILPSERVRRFSTWFFQRKRELLSYEIKSSKKLRPKNHRATGSNHNHSLASRSMKAFKALAALAITAAAFAPAANASWGSYQNTDKWGEPDGSYTVHSETVAPTRTPDFPYSNIKARVAATTQPGSSTCMIGLELNMDPNLTGTQYVNGSKMVGIDVMVNGQEKKVKTMVGRSLVLLDPEFTPEVANADTFKVLLPMHVGNHVFDFNMSGAKEAIAKACN